MKEVTIMHASSENIHTIAHYLLVGRIWNPNLHHHLIEKKDITGIHK